MKTKQEMKIARLAARMRSKLSYTAFYVGVAGISPVEWKGAIELVKKHPDFLGRQITVHQSRYLYIAQVQDVI